MHLRHGWTIYGPVQLENNTSEITANRILIQTVENYREVLTPPSLLRMFDLDFHDHNVESYPGEKGASQEDPEQDGQLPESKVTLPSDDNIDVVIPCVPEQTNSNACVEEQCFAHELSIIEIEETMREDDIYFEKMCKCLTLSIVYAANVGGMPTLTGTGPNLVPKGQVDTIFGTENGINFTSWFLFAFPNTLFSLILSWIWLKSAFFVRVI